uniref:Uncharacterized protein n=1 Tax=Trichuris muris TaxID=70415 RepID=A0A5S6Q6N5_TRIMR
MLFFSAARAQRGQHLHTDAFRSCFSAGKTPTAEAFTRGDLGQLCQRVPVVLTTGPVRSVAAGHRVQSAKKKGTEKVFCRRRAVSAAAIQLNCMQIFSLRRRPLPALPPAGAEAVNWRFGGQLFFSGDRRLAALRYLTERERESLIRLRHLDVERRDAPIGEHRLRRDRLAWMRRSVQGFIGSRDGESGRGGEIVYYDDDEEE